MKKSKWTTSAKIFRDARTQAGMSQMELARAIGYRSPQYISNYEREICGFPTAKIKVAAKVLGLDAKKVAKTLSADLVRNFMIEAGLEA